MIQLQGIGYSVGSRRLFSEVDWVIAPGDRFALVGPNGAGKTTLARIALAELSPDPGVRVAARGTRMGHLPQEAAERFSGTVLQRAQEAYRHVHAMRAELDALHQRLAESTPGDPGLPAWLERAGELQHRLDLHDEHALEPEARRVLTGLGFSTADQDRPMVEFSGGWRMRAALAALLLEDPSVLFLDEPTNHLDLPAMEWLEDYLRDFHGGLVVISHDRVFLDRVTDHVKELEFGRLNDYPMTFTRYLEEREQRREQVEAQNQQLDQKIAQLERFVERFGAKNTKASQAQSKRKQIARLEERRQVLPRRPRGIRFQFPQPPHAGRILARLHGARFGYDSRDVLHRVSFEIGRGERVAIVGANGAGKTTLLRLIGGQLAPREGVREIGPLTRMTYFAQHAAETLEPDATVLSALEDVASAEWRPRLRSLLGTFLFSGDDAFKLCRVLSGGERQRVALARILLEPANLMLLDEPTHHLDIPGKEVLEEALDQYPGAIVVVTHDRSLMARLATRILEVEDGAVRLYPGGYEDYETSRLARAGDGARAGAPAPTGGPAPATRGGAPQTRAAAPQTRAGAQQTSTAPAGRKTRATTRNKQESARIEKQIEGREQRIREIETQLADPELYKDGSRSRELVGEYEKLRAEVEALWDRLADLG